jgi:hypothetical protein
MRPPDSVNAITPCSTKERCNAATLRRTSDDTLSPRDYLKCLHLQSHLKCMHLQSHLKCMHLQGHLKCMHLQSHLKCMHLQGHLKCMHLQGHLKCVHLQRLRPTPTGKTNTNCQHQVPSFDPNPGLVFFAV